MTEQQLTDEMVRTSGQILRLQLYFMDLKEQRRAMRMKHTDGTRGNYTTVYRVNEVRVRGYTRSAYTAIRITRGQIARSKDRVAR